jgi:sucrose-6-phosphate hydrolase SacC (GH32 family)
MNYLSTQFQKVKEVHSRRIFLSYLIYKLIQHVHQELKRDKQLIWIYIDRILSQSNPDASRYPLAGTIWLQSQSVSNQCFLQLNVFIDHSVIEVFESQEGRMAITTRIYPEDDTARNLAVYVNGGPTTNEFIIINSLDIWPLDSIWT